MLRGNSIVSSLPRSKFPPARACALYNLGFGSRRSDKKNEFPIIDEPERPTFLLCKFSQIFANFLLPRIRNGKKVESIRRRITLDVVASLSVGDNDLIVDSKDNVGLAPSIERRRAADCRYKEGRKMDKVDGR